MNRDDWMVVYALAAFAGILAFGTVMYSWLENWSLLDSLYFTLFTALTIGFGDIVPSPENRLFTAFFILFTAFFILVCTTMALACVAVIGNWIVSRIQHRSAQRRTRLSDERVRLVKRRFGDDSDGSR